MKPTKRPAREKNEAGKERKKGGEKAKSKSQDCCVTFKVSVNENFSTLLDIVFFYFWHEWVLNFILAEKENQKVLFNPSKMSLF